MKALFAAVLLAVVAGCSSLNPRPGTVDANMHLYQPVDTSWDVPLPQPEIPPPPTDTGLSQPGRLVDMEPIVIEGDEALAALPGIKGQGTESDPYVLENGRFTVRDTAGISITKTTRPLIIRNMQFNGVPVSEDSPTRTPAILLVDAKHITVTHCEVTRCNAIQLGGTGTDDMLISYCKLVSCINGIFSSSGRRVRALHNYVRDSVKYGVFLYNGADHEIGWNYVAWTQREGIGTNGTAPNHYYHDNVILHAGWTAVNVEGNTDGARVENNLVVDTFYGMVLMGKGTVCRNNRIFYSGQDGLLIVQSPSVKELRVTDNLIVGCGQNGIWAMPKSSGHTIERNRILMTNVGVQVNSVDTRVTDNDICRFLTAVHVDQPGGSVTGNHIYQGRNGIALDAGADSTVTGNRLHHLCIGLVASKQTGGTVADNNFSYVGQMLRVIDSTDMTVRGNTFLQMAYHGIDLTNSSGCTVAGNTLRNATARAIKIEGGSGNHLTNNRVSDCYSQFNGAGLILEKTTGNEVSGNTFTRCDVAILDEAEVSKQNTLTGNTVE